MAIKLSKVLNLLDISPDDVVGLEPKVRIPCPLHGGSDPNCFINTEGEGWYCHSVCQRGGKLTNLIAEYRDITTEEASLLLRGTKIHQSSSQEPYKVDLRVHKSINKIKHLPEGIWLTNTFRKISPQVLREFEVYLCTSGSYRDRIIIPLYNEEGKYIGFQTRRLYDHDKIGKYIFSRGIESGLILYNYNNAKEYKQIYIVEGAFGVINFHQHNIPNVVALIGGGFGAKREHMLLNHEIIVCVDNDLAGDAYRKKIKESKLNIIDIIIPPLGIDFDNMGEIWFKRLIKRKKICQVK